MFGKIPTAKYYKAMAMAQVEMGFKFQWVIVGWHWANRTVRLIRQDC